MNRSIQYRAKIVLICSGSDIYSPTAFWIARILFLLLCFDAVTWKNLVILSPSWSSWDLTLWCQKDLLRLGDLPMSLILLAPSEGFGLEGPCWIYVSSSLAFLILLTSWSKCFRRHVLDFWLELFNFIQKVRLVTIYPHLRQYLLILRLLHAHGFKSEGLTPLSRKLL